MSDTIVISSDEAMAENGSKVHAHSKNCSTFWEDCGEDDIKTPQYAETLPLLLPDAAMQQECWRRTSKWNPSDIRESCVETQ